MKTIEGEKPLIKNKIVERMFMSDATDNQMGEYVKLATSGEKLSTARATAYASRVVEVWHDYRKDKESRFGVDHEYQAHILFERKKK